jgi:hypothetical protein
VVAIAVAAIVLLRPSPPQPSPTPTTPPSTGPSGPSPEVIALKVQLAQKELSGKGYQAAIDLAGEVLKLNPGNAEALSVKEKAEAKLREVSDAVADARGAVAARDWNRARSAINKVMNLDPANPVMKELAEAMNAYYQGEAKTAREGAVRAQTAAEQARAGQQPAFREGQSDIRDGDSAFRTGQFMLSAQKFAEAQGQFDKARRAALEVVATHTPGPIVTPPPYTPPPITTPPSTPTPVVTPTPAPTPVRTPVPVNEEPAVRQVIGDFERGFNQKSLDQLLRVQPNMSPEERKRYEAVFAGPSQTIQFVIDSIQVGGGQATLRVTRRVTYQGKTGSLQQTLTLTKGPGGWTISSVQ